MYARHVTVSGDPANADEAIRRLEEVVMPVLRASAGFQGQAVLLDRASGTAIGISFWDTEENMHASEERVGAARQQVAASLGAGAAPEVRLYEVPIFETNA